MYKEGSYVLRVDVDNVSLMKGERIVCKGNSETLTYLMSPPDEVSEEEEEDLEMLFSNAVLRDGHLIVEG